MLQYWRRPPQTPPPAPLTPTASHLVCALPPALGLEVVLGPILDFFVQHVERALLSPLPSESPVCLLGVPFRNATRVFLPPFSGLAHSRPCPALLTGLPPVCTVDKKQLERLWKRFNLLDRTGNGRITRDEFRLLPELAGNPLADRILDCLEPEAHADSAEGVHEHTGEVDFKMFVRTLDVFCTANTAQRKIEILFKMYDMDGDGALDENDLRATFRRLVGVGASRHQVRIVSNPCAYCTQSPIPTP